MTTHAPLATSDAAATSAEDASSRRVVPAATATMIPLQHLGAAGRRAGRRGFLLSSEVPEGAKGVLRTEEHAAVVEEINDLVLATMSRVRRNMPWLLLPVAGIAVLVIRAKLAAKGARRRLHALLETANGRLATAGSGVRYNVNLENHYIYLTLTEAEAEASARYRGVRSTTTSGAAGVGAATSVRPEDVVVATAVVAPAKAAALYPSADATPSAESAMPTYYSPYPSAYPSAYPHDGAGAGAAAGGEVPYCPPSTAASVASSERERLL